MRNILLPLARKIAHELWQLDRENFATIGADLVTAHLERLAEIAFFAGLTLGFILSLLISTRFGG